MATTLTPTSRTIAGTPVNPVGLGCMNLSWAYGTPPDEAYATRLLNRALDLGCNHLDTANIYGGGKNEELLRRAVGHRRAEYFLASKCGIVVDGPKRGVDCSPAKITEAIDATLIRLGTDHLDLFYMHRFDPKVPIADSVGAMVRAIEAGKIRSYGVSEWSAAHIREAAAIHVPAAAQPEYSLWTRNVELGVRETCRELGIALVAFSPVGRGALGGVLRDPATLEEQDLRHKMPRFMAENWPHNLALIDRLGALARANGLTTAQLALAWVLAQGPHCHVIPGTTSIEHLHEDIAALDVHPGDDVLDAVGALINNDTVHGPRYTPAQLAEVDAETFDTTTN